MTRHPGSLERRSGIEATSMVLKSVCERAVNSAPLQTHSATGPEFNDGDECDQNKDHQYHELRDRERWFRLRRSQRIESRNFHEALHDKNKDV